MSSDPQWTFVRAVPDGQCFKLDGIDVWEHKWIDTKERARVEDPLYHRELAFEVYEIRVGDKVLRFAAGEFSNCMWGFYTAH